MDDTVLAVCLAVVVGPPAIFVALGLSKVDDAFKIREELIGTIIGGLSFQGMYRLTGASPRGHSRVNNNQPTCNFYRNSAGG